MPPPLKIVHYLPAVRLADGGIARAVLDWCAVLASRGHRVTLLTRDATDVRPAWSAGEGGEAGEAATPRAIAQPTQFDQAVAGADVLHLHAPWYPGNRALAAQAVRHGVPYVLTVHGMLDDWSMAQRSLKKRLYLRLLGRRFLNAAARVHCTAEAELAQAGKWFTNPRTTVLPYLVDLSAFAQLPGPAQALALTPDLPPGPRLLFLSRLHEKKGLDVLIRAVAILRDAGNAAVLLVAGSGDPAYVRHLQGIVRDLDLTSRVHFLGLVTGAAKVSLYQSADLFVLPTFQENFGLVLAEAMACGTPVLTTRGTDIWQEVQRGGGTIADATPAALADAIATLLADPTHLATLGEQGRRWAFDTLAVEPLAQRYEAWYRQVAGAGAGAGE